MNPSLENQSSGFPTRLNTNQAVQSQKMAKSLKFQIEEVEELYYPCHENKAVFVFAYAKFGFSQDVAHIMS